MPVPLTPYPPSRWMVLDFSASSAAQYPTNGQGGTTPTPSSSALFGSQKVIITGITVITVPLVALSINFVNMSGVTLFSVGYVTNAAADRATPPMWLELKHGFGVSASGTDTAFRVLVSYIPVN